MRRPAQTRPGLTAARGWAHPYTGVAGLAVFYNDGGTAPVPTPADIAARAAQQPPAPVTPAPAGGDDAVLLDHGTGAPMTQGAFTKIMARENAKGRRNALREIAEAAGVPFSPDDFDVTKFAQAFKQAEAARQQALTDEQRRQEDLDRREQELQDRLAAADQRDAEIKKARRTSQLEAALVRLGAVDLEDKPNLQDAFAMLERDLAATPDADTDAITAAAEKLKGRRPELFGTVAPQTLPPAPSGGPAGGNAPRQPASTKDAVTKAAHDRARRMGLRTDDAA